MGVSIPLHQFYWQDPKRKTGAKSPVFPIYKGYGSGYVCGLETSDSEGFGNFTFHVYLWFLTGFWGIFFHMNQNSFFQHNQKAVPTP